MCALDNSYIVVLRRRHPRARTLGVTRSLSPPPSFRRSHDTVGVVHHRCRQNVSSQSRVALLHGERLLRHCRNQPSRRNDDRASPSFSKVAEVAESHNQMQVGYGAHVDTIEAGVGSSSSISGTCIGPAALWRTIKWFSLRCM